MPQSAVHALLQPPPYYFYIALVVLLILETLGVVGSLYYAQSVRNSNIDASTNIAMSSARDLEKLMDDQKGPILQVATAVAMVSGCMGSHVRCGLWLMGEQSLMRRWAHEGEARQRRRMGHPTLPCSAMLSMSALPPCALSSLRSQNPNWPSFNASFNELAYQLSL